MNDSSSTLRLSIGYTLIDITKTNEVSGIANNKARHQQRNWETLVQVLGLRAQLITLSTPDMKEVDTATTNFGVAYKGKHKVWSFTFGVEQEAVFANQNSSHGTLESDFINVPIITGLDETTIIPQPIFVVTGPHKNIYFEQLKF